MSRLLVTGAAGFLGDAVVRRLLARPDVELVVALDIAEPAPHDERLVAVRRDVAAGVGGLLTDHRIDTVVHHAFVIRPPRDPNAARRTNVEATVRLAADAAAAGVRRIVYPSSTTVYGAHPGAGLHSEDETPRPLEGFRYSEHKVAAERALREAEAGGGASTIILRACIVTGPGRSDFILRSLATPILPVPSGADPPMQFLAVSDYLSAVEAALAFTGSGTFNVAGAGTIALREMAGILGSRVIDVPEPVLRRIIDWSWRLRLQGRSTGAGLGLITHPWLASTDRARRDLGWEPDVSSREAVVAWARARHR